MDAEIMFLLKITEVIPKLRVERDLSKIL